MSTDTFNKERDKLEIWKLIEDFPKYEVSNFGRVRSNKVHWRSSLVLKFNVNRDYYHKVVLFKQKKAHYFLIHRLVLEAFIGPCPKGHQANHKNGIKTDNRDTNLEWVTPGENLAHAYQMGLSSRKGIMHPRAKLKNEDILEIRKRAQSGTSREILAQIFGIHKMYVGEIVRHEVWNHI